MEDVMSQDTTQALPAEQVIPSDLLDEIFARQLRATRQAAGLTQQQLADLTGMHRSAIAKIEGRDRVVSVGEAAQIATALGVALAELVSEPGHDRARVEAQVRLRSAELTVARHRDLMEEAQLLYAHALEVADEARAQLAALDGED